MKKLSNRPRLALHRETIAPMLLERVTGGGILADITPATTGATALTVYATRWCKPKPGGK